MLNGIGRAREMIEAGAKVSVVARACGLPYSTIADRVNRKIPWGAVHGGQNQVLTNAEEEHMVHWLEEMCRRGVPVGIKGLQEEVRYTLQGDTRETPFTDGTPGRKWVEGFLRRHPEIRRRISQLASRQRMEVTEGNLTEWFNDALGFFVTDEGLLTALSSPDRIWNMDETGFNFEGRSGRMMKVLVPAKGKNPYTVKQGSRQLVTCIAAMNAAGTYMPPFLIYPGLNLSGINATDFPGAFHYAQKSGWADGKAFLQWIIRFDEFLESKAITRPVILTLDNHVSHRYLPALKYAKDKKICVYALLPNATHLIQPLDVGFFGAFKQNFSEEAGAWGKINYGQTINKASFVTILRPAWEKTATKKLAENAFRHSGLYPFTVKNVDRDRLKKFAIEEACETDNPDVVQQMIDIDDDTNIDTALEMDIEGVIASLDDNDNEIDVTTMDLDTEPASDIPADIWYAMFVFLF